METGKISFKARATGTSLGLSVRFNSQQIYHSQDLPLVSQEISCEFDDSGDTENLLEIEMSGKISDHTSLDQTGNVISDRVIEIKDILLDGIDLEHLVTKLAEYHHDHNGTTEPVTTQFFGIMGCNGVVKFRFSSPLYLWILENM